MLEQYSLFFGAVILAGVPTCAYTIYFAKKRKLLPLGCFAGFFCLLAGFFGGLLLAIPMMGISLALINFTYKKNQKKQDKLYSLPNKGKDDFDQVA
ncbi:MAG: hypothetical protein JNM93_01550 [Bacteriovoracaceae bacterium]|nr:hypothetical protein [Bacteriovoracaceae bacterium]